MSCMISQHSLGPYDDETLKALQQAVADIRAVLKARGLLHEGLKRDEFHRDLASTLLDLTDAGVTDRKELCQRALKAMFNLERSH
jgi:hypothetical protein